MAEEQSKKEAEEEKPELGQALFKLGFWIVAIVALGAVAYMVFFGSDPRRQFSDPDETLRGYTSFVSPYVGTNAALPDNSTVEAWLEFFDSDSRDFFNDNAKHIARLNYLYDQESYDKLGSTGLRGEAMKYVVGNPPLSGIIKITTSRTAGDGVITVGVLPRGGNETTMRIKEAAGLYYIMDLGGLEQSVRNQISRFNSGESQ